MRQLMHGLRFTGVNSWSGFKREFDFSIESGELRKDREVLRFD